MAINPRSVGAMVGLARVDAGVGLGCFADDRRAHLAAAEATLVKALSLAPNYAGAHLVLGAVQIHTNRAAQGMAESKRALALDHNLASAHAQIGLAKSGRR